MEQTPPTDRKIEKSELLATQQTLDLIYQNSFFLTKDRKKVRSLHDHSDFFLTEKKVDKNQVIKIASDEGGQIRGTFDNSKVEVIVETADENNRRSVMSYTLTIDRESSEQIPVYKIKKHKYSYSLSKEFNDYLNKHGGDITATSMIDAIKFFRILQKDRKPNSGVEFHEDYSDMPVSETEAQELNKKLENLVLIECGNLTPEKVAQAEKREDYSHPILDIIERNLPQLRQIEEEFSKKYDHNANMEQRNYALRRFLGKKYGFLADQFEKAGAFPLEISDLISIWSRVYELWPNDFNNQGSVLASIISTSYTTEGLDRWKSLPRYYIENGFDIYTNPFPHVLLTDKPALNHIKSKLSILNQRLGAIGNFLSSPVGRTMNENRLNRILTSLKNSFDFGNFNLNSYFFPNPKRK